MAEVTEGTKDIKWKHSPVNLSVQYEVNLRGGFCYVKPVGKIALRCVRCSHVVPYEACPNCGGESYEVGGSTSEIGMFCERCHKGRTRWICPECHTDNAVVNTVVEVDKSMCFVATACAGYDSWEVQTLSYWRNEVLLRSDPGRLFVKAYYRFSPRPAEYIGHRPILRRIVRYGLVRPLATLVRKS
jgi:hypothetical protein